VRFLRPNDMRRWIGLTLSCALLAGCGVPQSVQPASDSGPTLSGDDAVLVETACAGVVEALTEGVTSASVVSSLEDLDATLSSVGATDLRTLTEAASDGLPAFGDTPLSDADLSEVASGLIELSNELVAAGVGGNCGGIGEVAAEFEGGVGADKTTAERLDDAHNKWVSADLQTYSMELSVGPGASTDDGCGTGGSLVVQVSNGRLERAIDRMSGCEPSDSGGIPLTVDDLFTLISDHLDAGVLDVEFDPSLGYPRITYIQDELGTTEVWVMDFQEGRSVIQSAEDIFDQVADERDRWAAMGVSNYTVTVEVGCFCPDEFRGPFEVTVVDGAVIGVTMNGENVVPQDETFLTVEGLFATIEDYAYSDEITVTYSPLGYPTTIDIDPSRDTFDEELRIDVRDLITSEP
jgi:hypothetical protein